MDGIAPAPAIVTPPAPAPDWTLSNAGASGLTAASVALLFLYLTCRFIWLYNKDDAAAEAAAASASFSSPPALSLPPAARAVPVSVLPVFVHMEGEEVRRAECAVCLAEFGAGDAGRLLPRCGHGFHEECIATWLRLNTTCPLCRAPVVAAK